MSVPWGMRALVHTFTLISGNLLAFLSTAGDAAGTAGAGPAVNTKENSCGISTHVSIAYGGKRSLRSKYKHSGAAQLMVIESQFQDHLVKGGSRQVQYGTPCVGRCTQMH